MADSYDAMHPGQWVNSSTNESYTLIEEAYVKEMFTVQHPEFAAINESWCGECMQYSLLSYVLNHNTPLPENERVKTCNAQPPPCL